ncbi:MAG: hypothetical protein MZV64_14000 [Ignavibacteriales bacterium]|nr:hypothetical protein [Ignavibacteriales bacterium]
MRCQDVPNARPRSRSCASGRPVCRLLEEKPGDRCPWLLPADRRGSAASASSASTSAGRGAASADRGRVVRAEDRRRPERGASPGRCVLRLRLARSSGRPTRACCN